MDDEAVKPDQLKEIREDKSSVKFRTRFVPKGGPLEYFDVIFLIAAVLYLFWQVRPDLIFSSSIPTGGDYGGHLDVPWYLMHHLLPQGRVTGWSPDWYNGWPLNVFYFPIPSLFIALLSFVIPYVVAFKMVVVLGTLLLPISLWCFARSFGAPLPVPGMLGIGSLSYLFNYAYTIDGGNIFSTMAGEYSFSLSLAFSFFFFSRLLKWMKTGTGARSAAVLFGLTLASHLLGGFLAIGGAFLLTLLFRRGKGPHYGTRMIKTALIIIVGFAITAIWAVPFAGDIAYSTNMGYSKVTTYMLNLFPSSYLWVFWLIFLGAIASLFAEKLYVGAIAVLTGLGIALIFSANGELCFGAAGVVAAGILYRKRPMSLWFSVLGLVTGVAFVVLSPNAKLYNPRMLPLYSLAIYMMAAIGAFEIGNLLGEISRSYYRQIGYFTVAINKWWNASSGVIFTMLTTVPLTLSLIPYGKAGPFNAMQKHVTVNYAPSWVAYNFTGYQAKSGYPEYKAFMNMMATVGKKYGCGRAFWEYSSDLDRFGSPMAPFLLPYFTQGCIDSEEGLFFESSATTPFHFLNQSEMSSAPDYAMSGLPYIYNTPDVRLGVEHLSLMGVRYFMTSSELIYQEASLDPSLSLIATSGPWNTAAPGGVPSYITWHVFLVANSSLVQPLTEQPAVISHMPPPHPATLEPWVTAVMNWYQNPTYWPVELVASGPSSWKRVAPGNVESQTVKEPSVAVTDIKSTSDSISFHVSKVGVPILVKISYFPNWKAVGATGPYRASPNQMVVVPTSNNVTLYYGTTSYDWIGAVVAGFGFVGLWFLVLLRPHRRNPTKKKPANDSDFSDGPLWGFGDFPADGYTKIFHRMPVSEKFHKVFKAYDIRGLAPGELDADMCRAIGVSVARHFGEPSIVVARDMRQSGVELCEAFGEGVTSQGVKVVFLGLGSTDMLYYASGALNMPGAMFTASHNPKEYNGIKLCGAKAAPIGEETGLFSIRDEAIKILETGDEIIGNQDLIDERDALGAFANHVRGFLFGADLSSIKVVADAANGMGGLIAPEVFSKLPVNLDLLFGELDGSFPNHPADPIQAENLVDLSRRVVETKSDVGLAFDGDADRVFLVDDLGQPLSGSTTTAIVAKFMLEKFPGSTILHNLICSKSVPEIIRESGGIPLRTRVGHSFIKAEMASSDAVFGGEHSGHYYFRDNYRADSGIIAAMVVLSVLAKTGVSLSQLRLDYERYSDSGEINTKVSNTKSVLDSLIPKLEEMGASIDLLDGVTADFGDWWCNIRPSNTEPLLRLNVEAVNEEECQSKVGMIRNLIGSVSGDF